MLGNNGCVQYHSLLPRNSRIPIIIFSYTFTLHYFLSFLDLSCHIMHSYWKNLSHKIMVRDHLLTNMIFGLNTYSRYSSYPFPFGWKLSGFYLQKHNSSLLRDDKLTSKWASDLANFKSSWYFLFCRCWLRNYYEICCCKSCLLRIKWRRSNRKKNF